MSEPTQDRGLCVGRCGACGGRVVWVGDTARCEGCDAPLALERLRDEAPSEPARSPRADARVEVRRG